MINGSQSSSVNYYYVNENTILTYQMVYNVKQNEGGGFGVTDENHRDDKDLNLTPA